MKQTKEQTKVYLEIGRNGVSGAKIVADNAQESDEAHKLLADVQFEIRALNVALKSRVKPAV